MMDAFADFAPRFLLFALGTAAGVALTDLLKPARPSFARLRRRPRR